MMSCWSGSMPRDLKSAITFWITFWCWPAIISSVKRFNAPPSTWPAAVANGSLALVICGISPSVAFSWPSPPSSSSIPAPRSSAVCCLAARSSADGVNDLFHVRFDVRPVLDMDMNSSSGNALMCGGAYSRAFIVDGVTSNWLGSLLSVDPVISRVAKPFARSGVTTLPSAVTPGAYGLPLWSTIILAKGSCAPSRACVAAGFADGEDRPRMWSSSCFTSSAVGGLPAAFVY